MWCVRVGTRDANVEFASFVDSCGHELGAAEQAKRDLDAARGWAFPLKRLTAAHLPTRLDRDPADLTRRYGAHVSDALFVVVNGPPGSGKSTLARSLADALGLPLVAKDTIKDALLAVIPVAGIDASQQIGRVAIAAMFAIAAESPRGARREHQGRQGNRPHAGGRTVRPTFAAGRYSPDGGHVLTYGPAR